MIGGKRASLRHLLIRSYEPPKEPVCTTIFMHLCKKTSSQDGATKYLSLLEDGNSVESVFLEHRDKPCLSTQVGCV